MDSIDTVIVGAGVIGLAVARELAQGGHEVAVIERAVAIGAETSSRNSEVIHAGIYYPPGSLKARLCVEGRERLYAFLARHGVAHRRCGKLIVAADEQQTKSLEAIAANARANGVDDLEWLDAGAARALEPELACVRALFSPATGILDTHGYLLALRGEAEAADAAIALRTPVERVRIEGRRFIIEAGGDAPARLVATRLVNAAGLSAPALARRIEGLDPTRVPEAYFCKGNYFTLSGVRPPFSRLIYPVPEVAGLGVHVTLDIAGQCRFGPDVEWIAAPDYTVDLRRAEGFYAAIRRYWPRLPDGALQPGYAGIRPKLGGPHAPAGDFVIEGPAEHGIPGLVNLYGIESPGLTASLAIAREVAERLA